MDRKSKEIASFKASPSYAQAADQLRMFFLRGQTVEPEFLREAGILSKVYQVQSEVHVINILGYVLNKPFMDFDNLPAAEVERMLRKGDVCWYKEEARMMLEKVVKQMRSYRFELIPLVVVTDHEKEQPKFLQTVLIKVHCRSGGCSYVDISGRTYASFGDFQENNKLPHGMMCYPKGGIAVFDEQGELLVDCCEVGLANFVKGGLDLIVGLVGAAGTVGSIFATGGLAIPFVVVSCSSALYATGRGVEKLVDANQHGMSLNPFEDAEARNNWLMVSANLLTFASLGAVAGLAAATRIEGVTAVQIGRLVLANRIIRGVSAGVNAVTVLDSVVYMVNNWKTMSIYEKISLACAVCFCFREVINFANAERLIRTSQIEGMCKFFRGCSDSVVGGVSTVGHSFVTNVKKLFEGNDEFVAMGMKLIRTIVQDSFDVTVSDDFVHIRLFGFEYRMRNIISMPESELSKFLYMIQGIAKTFKDAFALMRKFWGDGPIATAVFKRAEDLGGNRADYGKAINELIEIFMLVRRICDDVSILTDAELKIGAGHRFTIGSAFTTFVGNGIGHGISLLRALLEMNPREINRMNSFRQQLGSMEVAFFSFVTHKSTDSAEMLSKIRFLLDVSEICTEKSIRITDLLPAEKTVEIESLVRIDLDQFLQAVNPDYMIDPKFFQICRCALANHRDFLEVIWRSTCLRPDREDKCFEKLAALDVAFQCRSDATVENVISFVSTMHCPDFSRFVTHSLFALDAMHALIRDMNLSEAKVNEILFADVNPLRSRFLELTAKAGESSLGGYHAIGDAPMPDDAEPEALIRAVKEAASREVLRFGTTENGALHLAKYPMLRFGSEVKKCNRLIARKKFEREEVQSAYAGKRLVFLGNEHLRIVVGVVRGVGAYIDTFMFTHVE